MSHLRTGASPIESSAQFNSTTMQKETMQTQGTESSGRRYTKRTVKSRIDGTLACIGRIDSGGPPCLGDRMDAIVYSKPDLAWLQKPKYHFDGGRLHCMQRADDRVLSCFWLFHFLLLLFSISLLVSVFHMEWMVFRSRSLFIETNTFQRNSFPL